MLTSRLFAIAGGALLVGGVLFGLSLLDDGKALTSAEWCAEAKKYNDEQSWDRFYVGIAAAKEIPEKFDGRNIGRCSGGVCVITQEGGKCEIKYAYKIGPAVKGKQIIEIFAPPQIAGGWRAWALDGNAEWYGPGKTVLVECAKKSASADCIAMFGDPASRCWLLSTGDVCRHGMLSRTLTEGDNPPLPCPWALIDKVFPCVVIRGAGSEWEDVAREFTEGDFNG